MDARLLLDNFATITEAPDGVRLVRALILDLAVRGSLVAQNPKDEPAESVLRTLTAGDMVEPSSLIEPIHADHALWTIPGSWRWTRLKSISDFAAGRTPPTKDSTFWSDGEGHHWVAIGDMPHGGEIARTARKVSYRARDEIFRQEPDPPGTILMSFKLTIGKMARLAVPAFHNEAIISIDSPFDATKEYLFRTLPLLTQTGDSRAAIKGDTASSGGGCNEACSVDLRGG